MKTLSSSTIICRTGWCDICAESKRPHTGQRFITVGSSGKYHLYHTDHIPRKYGFTPHLYKIHKVIGNRDVVYDSICCMEDCGVYLEDDGQTNKVDFTLIGDQWFRGIMLITDWNSLVTLKRDDDYFI